MRVECPHCYGKGTITQEYIPTDNRRGEDNTFKVRWCPTCKGKKTVEVED